MKITRLIKPALKEISGNKVRTFFMLISVFVGITALMTVVSLGQGTQEQIVERLDRMSMADTFSVRTRGGGMASAEQGSSSQAVFSLSLEDAADLGSTVPGILEVIPSTSSRFDVAGTAGNLSEVSVQGVTPSFQVVRSWDMEKGMFLNAADIENTERVAVIGQTIARILFPTEEPVGQMISIENISFEVIGVLAMRGAGGGGGRDTDEVILVPVSTFARLFDNARVNNLTVWVEDPVEIEAVALASQNFFDSLYPNDPVIIRVPSLTTGTRQETSANLASYLNIIAAVALLVGGVMIMNIMFLSVSERTWEIGLRKALGATKSDIIKQVLLEVLLVSLAGGLLGILGGVLAVNLLTAQEIVRASLSWEAPALALGFSLLVGLIFGLRPAMRAASLNPVEALRSVE